MGKAKEQAKTDIEKLKLKGSNVREMMKEASKIIHVVHDKVKDKEFKLELTWVGKETGGKHKPVDGEDYKSAETYGLNSVNEDEDQD